jgi:hypothetical protein
VELLVRQSPAESGFTPGFKKNGFLIRILNPLA